MMTSNRRPTPIEPRTMPAMAIPRPVSRPLELSICSFGHESEYQGEDRAQAVHPNDADDQRGNCETVRPSILLRHSGPAQSAEIEPQYRQKIASALISSAHAGHFFVAGGEGGSSSPMSMAPLLFRQTSASPWPGFSARNIARAEGRFRRRAATHRVSWHQPNETGCLASSTSPRASPRRPT
jgi:hypothetical protein